MQVIKARLTAATVWDSRMENQMEKKMENEMET